MDIVAKTTILVNDNKFKKISFIIPLEIIISMVLKFKGSQSRQQ